MKAIVIAASLAVASWGCAHKNAEDRQKGDYVDIADDRIDKMEDNVEELEERKDELLGLPREELSIALEDLKRQMAEAQAELDRLEDADDWLALKGSVDQQLIEMDEAYTQAIAVLQAH